MNPNIWPQKVRRAIETARARRFLTASELWIEARPFAPNQAATDYATAQAARCVAMMHRAITTKWRYHHG